MKSIRIQIRLLWISLVLLAALAAAAWLDRADSRRLRAEAIQLVDPAGNVRAELAIRDGSAGLYIDDDQGRSRAWVGHDESGTALYFFDETGTIRIGVAQFAHGGGGVALHGPDSKGAVVLYLKEEGNFRIFDADGNVIREIRGERADD